MTTATNTTTTDNHNGTEQHCTRCDWKWYQRSADKPRVCPGCHSPYWDRERRVTKAAKAAKAAKDGAAT